MMTQAEIEATVKEVLGSESHLPTHSLPLTIQQQGVTQGNPPRGHCVSPSILEQLYHFTQGNPHTPSLYGVTPSFPHTPGE